MQHPNRKTARRRQLKSAIIAFNNRHSTLPASMRDISDSGARLSVAGNIVPDTFELLVEMDGFEIPCRVVWRRTSEVGVAFTGPPVKKAPRRTQVVGAVADHTAPPSLRKKPSPATLMAEIPQAGTAPAASPPAAEASRPAPAIPAPMPAPAPVKLSPLFPAQAQFAVGDILGLPESTEDRLERAIHAELAASGRDTGRQTAAYVIDAAFSVAKLGANLTYAYVVDVLTRGGRPMHRINGNVSAVARRGQSIWETLETDACSRIARMIVSDIESRIAED